VRTEYLLSSVGRVSGGWRVRMLDTGNGRAPTAPLERVSSSRGRGAGLAILDSRTNQKPQTPPGPVAQHAAAVPYRQRADVPKSAQGSRAGNENKK
jgi:hypothetical protein